MVDVSVKIFKGGYMPYRHFACDAGIDLVSPRDVYVGAGDSEVIDTLVSLRIPEGYAGIVLPRSSMNVNLGCSCTGLIDANYNGSINIRLFNHSDEIIPIYVGDRFAQIAIVKVPKVRLTMDYIGSDEDRGENGFGSSGWQV